MEIIQFQGNIWSENVVQPELWSLLLEKDRLIVIDSGQPPYPVVLGVPHHAGPGVNLIAEKWINPKNGRPGRPADEVTGLMGLAVFRALKEQGLPCRLVIAAHPTENDPNKTPGSPYWQEVFNPSLKPGLLFELHGAAERRRHSLELSAGMNPMADPLQFGQQLAARLDSGWLLAVQRGPGTREALVYHDRGWSEGLLQNPALETPSLLHAGQVGIPALHLEMKPLFRKISGRFSATVSLSPAGWALARALAEVFAAGYRDSVRKM